MAERLTNRQVDDLLAKMRRYLPDLKSRYGIRTLGIFGSYVRGTNSDGSDLDLLVEYDRVPTLFQLSALQREMNELSGINVDLVLKKNLKPHLGKRILAEVVYL